MPEPSSVLSYPAFAARVREAGPWYIDAENAVRNARGCCPLGAVYGRARTPWPRLAAYAIGIPHDAAINIARAADIPANVHRPLLLALCGITPTTDGGGA